MSFETQAGAAKIVAASRQVSCELGDETLILNPDTGVYYTLGGVGARVWKAIEVPRTVAEIRDLLLSEYEVDGGQCEAEVRELLDHLASEGLVEFRAP